MPPNKISNTKPSKSPLYHRNRLDQAALWWKMSRKSLGLLPLAITKLLRQCLGRRSINCGDGQFSGKVHPIFKNSFICLSYLCGPLIWRSLQICLSQILTFAAVQRLLFLPETFIFPFIVTTTCGDYTFIFIFQIKIKRIDPTLIWHVPQFA